MYVQGLKDESGKSFRSKFGRNQYACTETNNTSGKTLIFSFKMTP
jgi:hypothetical protein